MLAIVVKSGCSRNVRIDGQLAGPCNQPLPVTEGSHIVEMDCACGYQPPRFADIFGGPATNPTLVSFTCTR